MKNASFETDLTDTQWDYLQPMLPKPKKLGRKPTDRRVVLDAILYPIAIYNPRSLRASLCLPNANTAHRPTLGIPWRYVRIFEQTVESLQRGPFDRPCMGDRMRWGGNSGTINPVDPRNDM